YHAIGTDHLGDRFRGGDLHDGNTGFFEFGGDRSAAARAGPSRGRQDNSVNSLLFDLGGHFPAESARVGKWIGSAAGGKKLIVELADHAASFHFAHRIHRHEAIRILLDESRVITAVGYFVFFTAKIVIVGDAVGAPASRGRAFNPIGIAFRNQSAVRDQHDFRF